MGEPRIDGNPIGDIINVHFPSGAYRRIGVAEDKLERFVVDVLFYGDTMEELDIDATDSTDARIIAELALMLHYEAGGEIKSIQHIPRGMMYL